MRILEAHDYELTGELIDTPAPAGEALFQIAEVAGSPLFS
jgi:hypothetical protein